MAKWYYYNESSEKIEVTGSQLKWLAKNGKIAPGTLVETENGKKALAKQVKGLTFIATHLSETMPPEIEPPKSVQIETIPFERTKETTPKSTWHYYNEEGEKNTVTGGQLKWLAKNGRITPETVVETENGKTVPARKVKGLTFIAMAQPETVTPESVPSETGIYRLLESKPPIEEGTSTAFMPEEISPFAVLSVEENPFTATQPQTDNVAVPMPPSEEKMDIACSGIIYSVADHATGKSLMLLSDISLTIKPNEFACLIGPSGSGKTTLLNILSGRNKPTHGQVAIGGYDLFCNFNVLKKRIAIVPQRDILYESLSSQEGLTYTAKLRLQSGADHHDAVNNTLQMVGLTAQAMTRVANLSGGQRKRACLGNELLSKPEVLFLDEVTSGLDEYSDFEIMMLLKDIAAEGKTVVIVTHNLANIEKACNKVVILTKHGCLAFCGTPEEAKEYFEIDSLGQIYQVLEKKKPTEWMQQFREHILFEDNAILQNSVQSQVQTNDTETFKEDLNIFSRQVRILLDRRLRIQLCDMRSLIVMGGQCLLVSLLIAFLFGNVNDITDAAKQVSAPATIVFLMVVSCLWFGCNNTAKEIVQERNIYLRERDVNLFPTSYLFSKLLFFGCIGSIQAIVLFGIVYYSTKIDISILGGLIMMLLLTFAGTAIGLCVSIFSKSENVASALVPIIIIPQIILAGFIYQVEGLLQVFSSFFISAYWGYGGTGSLLDMNDFAKESVNLDEWAFVPALCVVIFQLCILIGVSMYRLVSETTTSTVWNRITPTGSPFGFGVVLGFISILSGMFSKTTRDYLAARVSQFIRKSTSLVTGKLKGIVFAKARHSSGNASDIPTTATSDSKKSFKNIWLFLHSNHRIIDTFSTWCQVVIFVSLLLLIIGGMGWDILPDEVQSRISDWTRHIRVTLRLEAAFTAPPELELCMNTQAEAQPWE